jgi:hypothetical protein
MQVEGLADADTVESYAQGGRAVEEGWGCEAEGKDG